MGEEVSSPFHAHSVQVLARRRPELFVESAREPAHGNLELQRERAQLFSPIASILNERYRRQDEIIPDPGAQPQLKPFPIRIRANAIVNEPFSDPARQRISVM